jgi:hypothetical protein
MKRLLPIAILCVLASAAHAQRGGMRAGGSMRAGGGGYRPGTPAQAPRGNFHHQGFAPARQSSSFFGFGYGVGNYGWPYTQSYWPSYPWYGYSYLTGPPIDYGYGYNAQPAVTVVYPPQTQVVTAPAPVERANPIMREYGPSGQEIRPESAAKSSPIYLFAFQDHSIRAAASYWVEGKALHYVTLQREEKQAPLDTLDRSLTEQLNAERRVMLKLP